MPGTTLPPAYKLYRWFWTSLDWLYPPRCAACSNAGFRWCAHCQRSTKKLSLGGNENAPCCPICGLPSRASMPCLGCRQTPPNFTAARAWAAFQGPLRIALHRLKYQRDLALGEALSRPMIAMLSVLGWPVDLVVPVPLSKPRRAARGFNQAALLALPLALASKLPYHPRTLCRSQDTRSQVGLTVAQRKANVADAFQADGRLASGKSVLIVDDVTTTGLTLDACAQALKTAGAYQVFALTLARTVLESP